MVYNGNPIKNKNMDDKSGAFFCHLRKPPQKSPLSDGLWPTSMTNPSGLCSARSRHLLGSYISGQRTTRWTSCWANKNNPPFWSILREVPVLRHPPKKRFPEYPRIIYIYIYTLYLWIHSYLHISLIGFIWVCLKMGYIPNYSHLIGIMIINHWV